MKDITTPKAFGSQPKAQAKLQSNRPRPPSRSVVAKADYEDEEEDEDEPSPAFSKHQNS